MSRDIYVVKQQRYEKKQTYRVTAPTIKTAINKAGDMFYYYLKRGGKNFGYRKDEVVHGRFITYIKREYLDAEVEV